MVQYQHTHTRAHLVAEDLDDHGEANGQELLVVNHAIPVLVDQCCQAGARAAHSYVAGRANRLIPGCDALCLGGQQALAAP